MSCDGADKDEMAFSRADKNPDLERILGRSDDSVGAGDELAAFAHALRATCRVEPRSELGARHLAEISAATAAAAQAQPRPERRAAPTRRLALTLAALALSVPVLATGLAFAGVALPGPAHSAFERIGIELPNQGESAAEAPPSDSTEPADGANDPAHESTGTEASQERRNGAHGREVSRHGRCVAREARSGARHPNRPCSHLKEDGGGKPSGAEGAAPGRPDSPGNSAIAPGRTEKAPKVDRNAQGGGNAHGKSKENAQGKSNAKSNGKVNGNTKTKGEGRRRDPGQQQE